MDDKSSLGRSALSIAVQGSLSAIPGVGGTLVAAWTEYDTVNRFRRVQETIDLIRQKLSHLTLDVDPHGEAGMQLLDLVLDKSQREQSEKKREYLANIVVTAWVSDTQPEYIFEEATLFLRAIEVFGDADIAVLNKLKDEGPEGKTDFHDLKRRISKAGLTIEEHGRTMLIVGNHLCAEFAFAKRADDKPGKILISSQLSPEGIAWNCSYTILPRGQRFVDFILNGFPINPTSNDELRTTGGDT